MTPPEMFEHYAWTVLRTAAAHVGVSALACLGDNKYPACARVRSIVWDIIRQQTGTSYTMIGALFGRHYTTAMKAVHHPEDVEAVLAAMNGTEVPPAWVHPPCEPKPKKKPKPKKVDNCPRCGSCKVFRDKEAETDHPERRGRAWFCCDCYSQWTRRAAHAAGAK